MHSETWTQWIGDQWPFNRHPDVNEPFDLAAARLEQSGVGHLVPFLAIVAARYALWTADLPASERYHHAFPFGLLIHSGETVERAVAVGRDLMNQFDPVWHQVLVALALLHDCGRLFEVEVLDPHEGDLWDPLHQSLTLFRETRFISPKDPVRWRPGRGIRAHEYRSLDLQPAILGGYYEDMFRRRLDDAWEKYFERAWDSDSPDDAYPYAVAQAVACADQQSVREDRLRRRASGVPPEPQRGPPVRCYPSSGPTRQNRPETFPGEGDR